MNTEFEWDPVKGESNWRDHGITFETARGVFTDAFALEWVDESQGVQEPRYSVLGMVENRLLFVAYTMRARPSASFQPERQNPMNDGDTSRKTAGHDWSRADAMTDSDVHAAALNDPDAQPLTEESLARLRLVPRTKTMRRSLGLTQEAFAARYRIPLGTLRDWEQGRAEPDQTARAYLTVIARDPEAVSRALESALQG